MSHKMWDRSVLCLTIMLVVFAQSSIAQVCADNTIVIDVVKDNAPADVSLKGTSYVYEPNVVEITARKTDGTPLSGLPVDVQVISGLIDFMEGSITSATTDGNGKATLNIIVDKGGTLAVYLNAELLAYLNPYYRSFPIGGTVGMAIWAVLTIGIVVFLIYEGRKPLAKPVHV